jgi:hypothetical protein
MAEIVTPTSQELFPVPHSHVNYTFIASTVLEEYRTTRYLNRMINMFGQDCIIKGLEVTSINITSNDLLVNINKGTLIQDSTVINISNNFDKTITGISAASQINSDYIVVVYTSFQFQWPQSIPTSNPNVFSINIGILDTNINLIHSGDPLSTPLVSYNSNINRVVIYAANITELENILSEVQIGAYTYNIRANRQGGLDFDGYNDLSLLNPDGGIIT